MKSIPDKQFLDNMSRDPSNWKGPFYFNRKDPRLLVPKQHPSLGWTLNFANPGAFIAVAALVVVIVIIAYITKS